MRRIPIWARVPAIVALALVGVLVSTMVLDLGSDGGGHGSGTATEMSDPNGSDSGGHGSDGNHSGSGGDPGAGHESNDADGQHG